MNKTRKSSQMLFMYRVKKSEVIPRHAKVALMVPGRLRPWIFSTFGTTRVVGRQLNAPAAFTPEEIHGTHFQSLSRPMSKRPIGRPRTRWENEVLEDIRNMNVHNWKKMAQNRNSWKKAVEQASTLYRM